MNNLKGSVSFFKLLSSTVATVPGLLVLLKNLSLPPGFSSSLAGVIIEILSCLVVGFAWLNKNNFKNIPLRKFNLVFVLSLTLFIFFLLSYGLLFSVTVIDSSIWEKKMFIPLVSSDKIPTGSFQEYYDEFGPTDLLILLNQTFKPNLIITEGLVYTSFTLIFTMLTTTFTALWLRYEATPAKKIRGS